METDFMASGSMTLGAIATGFDGSWEGMVGEERQLSPMKSEAATAAAHIHRRFGLRGTT
jgi:hypothetical protein